MKVKVNRCPECGKRIRGKNHVDGSHHNKRVPQLKSKAKHR